MTELDRLRARADKHAAAFAQSFSVTSRRVRPVRLMDDAVHALDPEFRMLRRLETAVRKHPIVALATLMGLSWLAAQAVAGGRRISPSPRVERPARARRLKPPRNQQGDYGHGNEHNAEQLGSDEILVLASEESARVLPQASRP